MKKFFTFNSRQGFTLAEVLITLGIIGIVAALTIPTLVYNYKQRQTSVALKKRYAEFQEIIKLSVLENGNTTYWNWELETKEFVAKYITPYYKLNFCQDCWKTANLKALWFEPAAYAAPSSLYTGSLNDPQAQLNCYLGNISSNDCNILVDACSNNTGFIEYLQSDGTFGPFYYDGALCQAYQTGDLERGPEDEPKISYSLPDGSLMGFDNKDDILYIYVDLNGKGNPNKFGSDKFLMVMSGNTVSMFGMGSTDMINGEYGCSDSGNGMYCGAMIATNNWEIPDNYPKF